MSPYLHLALRALLLPLTQRGPRMLVGAVLPSCQLQVASSAATHTLAVFLCAPGPSKSLLLLARAIEMI